MIQLTVKGKPSHVRHLANDPEYLFAIEFHDFTKQTTRIGKERFWCENFKTFENDLPNLVILVLLLKKGV